MNRWCIWCNSTEHDWRDCDEHKEALRRDLIYYEGDWIHSMDSQNATPTEIRERRHEEGPREGNSGEKQLRDNRGNMSGGVIGSKGVFLDGSA